MNPFAYSAPTLIEFGPKARMALEAYVRGRYRRVMLITDEQIEKLWFFDDAVSLLQRGGATVVMGEHIHQNPKISIVRKLAERAKSQEIQAIVALGGGSVMDAAKLAAAAASMGTDPADHVWGPRLPVTSSLPTIMIPTLSATGTETNPYCVVVDDQKKEKNWCLCAHPETAILDQQIAASVPLRLMVWGAMDVLSHTFEYYFNGSGASEFQTRFSEAILHATMAAVRAILTAPESTEPRGELQWCALMAWGGLTKIGRGDADMTCHSIEESFSGHFDTHHGACLGVLTPRWMRMVSQAKPTPFARFARNVMGVVEPNDARAAQLGIERYVAFLGEIGAPDTYRDIAPIDDSDWELARVASNAWRIYGGQIGKLHPFTMDELNALLHAGRAPIR